MKESARELLEKIGDTLKPFEISTVFISSEKWSSISIVNASLTSFKTIFLKENKEDCQKVKQFKDIILRDRMKKNIVITNVVS